MGDYLMSNPVVCLWLFLWMSCDLVIYFLPIELNLSVEESWEALIVPTQKRPIAGNNKPIGTYF